jgi:hypothetical protein
MRSLIAATLIAVLAAPALAACPPGAYAWLGRNGVEYCRRDVVDPEDGIEACAAGTRAATDHRDAHICEKIKPAPSKSSSDARPY